jgi:predicted nucleic acid-binding protein
MAVKVVDASALGALLFGEPEAEAVSSRLGQDSLAAPTLLRYEIGNIAWKKLRRYRSLRAELEQALRLFDELDLDEIEVPISDAVDVAAALDLTVYDASYIWLARYLDAELVTLDRRVDRAWRE